MIRCFLMTYIQYSSLLEVVEIRLIKHYLGIIILIKHCLGIIRLIKHYLGIIRLIKHYLGIIRLIKHYLGIIDELIMRFEPPNPSQRWDNPCFVVPAESPEKIDDVIKLISNHLFSVGKF